MRAALDGDALHGALRSLIDTLITGTGAEVAAFNRRLRDHFDGFVIDPNGGPPVPLWNVQIPAHIEQPSPHREPLVRLSDAPRRGAEPGPEQNPARLPGVLARQVLRCC